jgi:hypothetical protein
MASQKQVLVCMTDNKIFNHTCNPEWSWCRGCARLWCLLSTGMCQWWHIIGREL